MDGCDGRRWVILRIGMASLLLRGSGACLEQRLPMRKIRDVLRLTAGGMSKRKIAASLSIGATAAGDCLRRARRAGLALAAARGADATRRWRRRSTRRRAVAAKDQRPQPDWPTIHRELQPAGRDAAAAVGGVPRPRTPTATATAGSASSTGAWEGRLSPTMRQTHVAGERLFVDYAGTTLEVIDAATGEVRAGAAVRRRARRVELHLCRGDLDADACPTGSARTRAPSPSSAACRRRWCRDNLKAGITKACFYEPAVNRTYAEMAAHYDTAIVPARPTKPRDKAKVEVGVQVATRWIIARLRNRRFFSLAELNAAIRELVTELNDRVTRHLGASRRALFEELERPALKPLPAEPYVYAEWKECRVGLDYHVEVEQHYYSVPHRCCARRCGRGSRRARSRSSIAASASPRICARRRTAGTRRCASTCRRAIGATPTGRRSGSSGRPARSAATPSALVEIILRERTHPEQGFRACLGILRLAKTLRPRAARGRLRPRARDRRALLHLGQLDPEERPRSPSGPHPPRTGRRSCTPTSAAPATTTEEKHAMLTHPTLDQLRALRLDGMADAFVELQAQDSAKRPRPRRMAGAAARPRGGRPQHQALPEPAARAPGCATARPSIEDVDYRTPRRLDKALFQQLATGRWIAEHRNLLITGPCGVGKSWLACALAQKACRDGHTVLYPRVPRLFAELELAHGDGRFATPVPHAGQGRPADPRRLGPGPAHRRPAARSDGDRRGPLRPRLDAHHQPAAGRHVARGHRRAHLRRRHPRSHRPQRLPPRARRALDARPRSGRSPILRSGRRNGGCDGHKAGQGGQEMTHRPTRPPARGAASNSWRSLRAAHGLHLKLDRNHEY